MERTLFQKIIDREIPATIEYEDDEFIAIRDIAPSATIHILIISKKMIASAHAIQIEDAPLVGRAFIVAQKIADKFGIAQSGYRVVTNINADAGQTIFHLHFHVLGGEPLGTMNSGMRNSELGDKGQGTGNRIGRRQEAGGRSRMLVDASIFVLAAIGLAVGFNIMNPKKIDWVKKHYVADSTTDADMSKYLNSGEPQNLKNPETQIENPSENSKIREAEKPKTVENPETEKPKTVESVRKFVAEPGVVKEITKKQFVALMEAAPYYLIDARNPETYAKGHIGNAHNYYGAEAEAKIPELLENVPKDRIVLIYCDGGECELSHHIADVLKNFGYGPIFIFTGGWLEWNK